MFVTVSRHFTLRVRVMASRKAPSGRGQDSGRRRDSGRRQDLGQERLEMIPGQIVEHCVVELELFL